MQENRALREELGQIAKRMKTLADQPSMTDPQKSEFGRLEKEAKQIKERLRIIEQADEYYTDMRRTGPPPNPQPGNIVGPSEEHDRAYKRAFNQYLRHGRGELTMEDRAILRHETRDMGVGLDGGAFPGSTSGFFVPVGFKNQIEDALKYYGPMLHGGRGYPTIMPTDTGAPLPWPTSNDTSVMGELIGEGQQVTTQDVLIGQIMFGAWKLSSKLVKVSLELIEDSAFDLETFLAGEFAKRIGRAVNYYSTLGAGTGSQQPYGIVPATLAGGQVITAVGSSTNDGVGGANTIGSDDMVRLEHSVDPLYRPGAAYMCNDSTIQALRMVKDKYGRPLWQPSIRDGEPDTINGYPVLSNPYMDQLQTHTSSPTVTRNTVLFGALEKFVIRRVRDISVLRLSERFADFGQIAFLAFYRFDSQLLDAGTHPTAMLQNVY